MPQILIQAFTMIIQMSKQKQVLIKIKTAHTPKLKKYPLIGEKNCILLKTITKESFFGGKRTKIPSLSSGADYQ